MLIATLSIAVFLALATSVLSARSSKKRTAWFQAAWLLLFVLGTLNVSCFYHRGYYDDRPYYYNNHVRVWRDGHDDGWHRAHGDVWEEERR